MILFMDINLFAWLFLDPATSLKMVMLSYRKASLRGYAFLWTAETIYRNTYALHPHPHYTHFYTPAGFKLLLLFSARLLNLLQLYC